MLLLDGCVISRGPHKGFPGRWYYQSYEIRDLSAGEHVLQAVVFHLGRNGPPSILTSGHGGFVLKAEGAYDTRLTTGKTAWRAACVPCQTYGGVTDPDTMTGRENIVCAAAATATPGARIRSSICRRASRASGRTRTASRACASRRSRGP